jgi:AcrR family transcriptional regulator
VARPAQINRTSVVEAALAVADEQGLDAVTMQKVASRLGVTSMALYRHVSSKADLFDALVEALLTQFPLPADQLPWRERLTRLVEGIRAAAGDHPGAFPLLLTRPAATPRARRVRDAVHAALREAGLPCAMVPRAERLLSTAVLGFAVSEAAGRFAGHSRSTRDADFALLLRSLQHLIEEVVEEAHAERARHRSAP